MSAMVSSADSKWYTLFGFSQELDRRPLLFVEPLPDHRVCSACGHVPKSTAFLPCRHVLCRPCFDDCMLSGGVCALDGEACPDGDVLWREYQVDHVKKRQVACWNRANGCEAVMAVSEISEHFQSDCAFHPACCHQCNAAILQGDMIAHIKSQCREKILTRPLRKDVDDAAGSRPPPVTDNTAHEVKAALQKVLEQNASLEARMAQLVDKDQELSAVQDELKRVTELLNRTLEEVAECNREKAEQADELASLKDMIDVFTREIVLAIHDNLGNKT